TKEIYLEEQIEGELDLKDFVHNDIKVFISCNLDESEFKIKNNKGEIIEPIKNEIKQLEALENKNLEKELKLVGFDSLVELNCSNNKIKELDIKESDGNCKGERCKNCKCKAHIVVLKCEENRLSDLEYLLGSLDSS
ncbi:4453_t:CDS:2, partial [Funneliformis geosporum]